MSQPQANFPSGDGREQQLERAMAGYNFTGNSLIEILHVAQKLYGYLTPPLLRHLAIKLRLPLSHVLGVATFYHLFSMSPKGEHHVSVCMGTACYVAGSKSLLETVAGSHGESTTFGTVRCVGSCGVAPVVLHDGKFRARMTSERLLRELRKDGGEK